MASLANMNKERVSASRNRSDSDSHTSTSTSSAMSGTQASTAASSVTDDPRADFKGDVAVNDNLPTQKMLDACAEVDLLDSEGKKHSFKSLFTEKTGPSRHLVVFVRHFFCGNCQEYVRTLCTTITPESLKHLSTPTTITVIGCGQPDLINFYAETSQCTFPLYADPSRKLYDTLGMTSTLSLGKKGEYIQQSLLGACLQSMWQIISKGSRGFAGGAWAQVGGEFLIENGKVTWCHRMKNTRDHAEIEDLQRILGLLEEKPPIRRRWSHAIKDVVRRRSESWNRSRSGSPGRRKQSTALNGVETPPRVQEERSGLLQEA